MPNKIFAIMSDSHVNPNNIQKQISMKRAKTETKKGISLFSKKTSDAAKAYTSAQVVRKEPAYYTAMRLLEEGLNAKDIANGLYENSQIELERIDGKKLFEEAVRNDFMPVTEKNNDVKRYFESSNKHNEDTVIVYEYYDGELTKKIEIKNNGELISSITNYNGRYFEEINYISDEKGQTSLHKYTLGKNTSYGEVIDKEYTFSTIKEGQLRQFRQGVSTNSDGYTTTKLIIDYNFDGKCKSAHENILSDETGKIIKADPIVNFNTQNNFYVIDTHKA